MPNDTIEDLDDTEYFDFRQLLAALMDAKDIIWTVPSDEVDKLKEGLQDRKAKDNVALKKQGLLPMTDTLEFLVYDAMDTEGKAIKGQSCVRAKLVPRKGINILKTEIPSNDF